MPLSEAILIIMGLLTIAMLAAGVCHNLPIPFTVFLVILGIVLGAFARSNASMHVLLDFQLTPDIVFFLFLPALIFESAFNLNARQLVKDREITTNTSCQHGNRQQTHNNQDGF